MNTRDQITEAARALGVEPQMRLVEPYRYQAILERIIAQRTRLGPHAVHALWWWEALADPQASVQPENIWATLPRLVGKQEPVWFVVEARKREGNFWLYESSIEPICAVLREMPAIEYYIVGKKMDWLLCENHHDYLIASGEAMVERLLRVEPGARRG